MKKILFDLNHPVDVNFFKNTINILLKENFNVDVIYRPRGKLGDIATFELPIKPIPIGKHYKKFHTKLVGQLVRDFKTYLFFSKKKYNLIVCFGPTSAISAKIKGIKYLAFDDDFEYKIPFYHANFFATKHIYPDFIKYTNKRVIQFHGYKELAYLHPNYFKPNNNSLNEFGLTENKYIFIRHISNISLNYKGETGDLNKLLEIIRKFNYKIVLSIEDKKLVSSLGSDVIVLKEPINDIYSLMNYSLLAISYGDTVARECSILGVPTIYLGARNMKMHDELLEIGVMSQISDYENIESILKSDLISKKLLCKEVISEKIKNEWRDTTEVILDLIYKYIS